MIAVKRSTSATKCDYDAMVKIQEKFVKENYPEQQALINEAIGALLIEEDFREAFINWRNSLKRKLSGLAMARLRRERRENKGYSK